MDAQPATGARKAVDTAFYDLFDLSPDATSAQIKRAYYKRARECHPDKHPNDAVKEAEFKKLSQAYQTLFDEERRAVYDAFGRDGMQSDESYADPRQVFAAVFGGPEFEPWVGVLGAAVDEELQAPLQAAQQRASENHAKLIALIKARAPADEIEATRAVQRTLQDIEDLTLTLTLTLTLILTLTLPHTPTRTKTAARTSREAVRGKPASASTQYAGTAAAPARATAAGARPSTATAISLCAALCVSASGVPRPCIFSFCFRAKVEGAAPAGGGGGGGGVMTARRSEKAGFSTARARRWLGPLCLLLG